MFLQTDQSAHFDLHLTQTIASITKIYSELLGVTTMLSVFQKHC